MRRHYRLCEVWRDDKNAYVIHRRYGWIWLRQWVPCIYFDFPMNWFLSASVFDSVDDAQDALYSGLCRCRLLGIVREYGRNILYWNGKTLGRVCSYKPVQFRHSSWGVVSTIHNYYENGVSCHSFHEMFKE